MAKQKSFQIIRQDSAFGFQRDTSCYAKNEPNRPGKSAFDNKYKIGGVGGLNIARSTPVNNKKKSASSTPTKVATRNSNKNENVTKTPTPGDNKAYKPQRAEIDWSKVILAFLTPWRNPNSLFLYLLIIVSVLGKVNENPH